MSPRLKLTLDDAVDFTPLEDGEYPVSVLEFSETRKGEKSSYITVTLEVAEDHDAKGRRLWSNLPLDGKGAGIFVNFINACLGTSYTIEEYRDEGLEVDTEDLEGAELVAIVKQEEYPEGSGEMRAQVKQLLPA